MSARRVARGLLSMWLLGAVITCAVLVAYVRRRPL